MAAGADRSAAWLDDGVEADELAGHLTRLESMLRTLPADATALRRAAETARHLRHLERVASLADQLDLTPGELDDALRVARALIAERLAGNSVTSVDPSNWELLPFGELFALTAWASGATDSEIADTLRVGEKKVEVLRTEAVRQLASSTSGGVLTEAEVRGQARSRHQGKKSKLWFVVREWLRSVEDGLHPAERALWDRDDRIEELIGDVDDPNTGDDRYRDRVYRALIEAGITSISHLATLDDAALTAIGIMGAARTALREALNRYYRVDQAAVQALIAAGITSVTQLAATDDARLATIGIAPSSRDALRRELRRRAETGRAERRAAVALADAMRNSSRPHPRAGPASPDGGPR